MGEGSFEEADRGKMDGGWDLGAIAREILDANLYMTLGTADGDGRPWVSPVWYAAEGYARFYWVSSPEARHSRNIATRPQVSIVVFDSTAPEGMGQAVYVSATAEELTGSELERGIGVFSRASGGSGAREWGPDDVRPPAPHRLYRATASEHWVLDPDRDPVDGSRVRDRRMPVAGRDLVVRRE